jgi:protein phosphatase
VLLVGVVSGAGYYFYRLAQNQYYVGTAGGRVVVFRGLSEAVAGVSLSTVVQRTDIPLSALPSSEVSSIKSTIGPEANLKQAQRIISQFRHDYRCAVVAADIVKWAAHRPKPKPKPKPVTHHHSAASHSKKPTRHLTAAHRRATHHPAASANHAAGADKAAATKQAKYPPEPVMPPFCPAYSGAAG